MKIRHLVVAAAALSIAVSALAQLSYDRKQWGEGAVQLLMTAEEKAAWSQVTTDAAADKFIKLFWLRRDPSLKADVEAKIKYADEHFTQGKTRGSLSDRGKALLLYGVPTKVTRSGGVTPSNMAAPNRNDSITTPSSDERNALQQTWLYEGAVSEKAFGMPRAELVFLDRLNNGDFRLEAPRFDIAAAQARMIKNLIVRPELTLADLDKPIPPPPAPAPVAPPPPSTTLKTAALETAVAEAKSGKSQPKGATITYAELMSPIGEPFVPVALYIPKSSGVTADSADTFFLTVDDASGKRVLAVEEPVKLLVTHDDFEADYSLSLPAGKYNVVAGVAKAGLPLLFATSAIDVASPSKDAVGTSKLILTNNIVETADAAPVKAPFAFGKLKIVPKGDLTFTNKDSLGYFVEVNNPGIDSTTLLPKLQMKVDLVALKGGRTIGAPLAEAGALPLAGKAGPGHYAIINEVPLAQLSKPLEPGDYALKMKIVDTVTKQSYTVEQTFRITG